MNFLAPIKTAAGDDDCWKLIGIEGDQSCALLAETIHCRNCPVYAAAATRFLDRPATIAALPPRTPARANASLEATLIFRIGDEWLGLPAAGVHEVLEPRPLHALPHRRNHMVLGLVNVRGVLTVAVSLAELLGVGPARHPWPGAIARMLVIGDAGHTNVLPVEAVAGIERFAQGDLQTTPGTVSRASATYTRAVVPWRDGSVGLLDAGLLQYSIDRGLA